MDYSSPKSPVVSRLEYIQMMQHQQQVRSILKFNATPNEGRQQQHGNGGGADSSKPQRFQKKNSSWKSHATQERQTSNSRNLWELSNTTTSTTTPTTQPQMNHNHHPHKMGITSPTSSQSSKDSLSSIWFTPPQSHSPASSSGSGDLGFNTSTPVKSGQQPQVGRMIRAQDLSGGCKEGHNIWASAPPQLPSTASRFVPMLGGGGDGLLDQNAKGTNACLQLFSDNFMSYLNMIN